MEMSRDHPLNRKFNTYPAPEELPQTGGSRGSAGP